MSYKDQNSEAFLKTIDAMIEHGGSFVRHLAEAWKRADHSNHARLCSTFDDYLKRYYDDYVKSNHGHRRTNV